MDDPFWRSHHPGDHWNCKCSLEQNNDPVVRPADISADPPQPGLDNNPGKDGHTFSDNHPYFPSGCTSCPFNKGAKNIARATFRNEKKHCYQCDKIDNALPAQQEGNKAKSLVDDVKREMRAKKLACKIYSFKDDEVSKLREHGIDLSARSVFLSDQRLLHAIRDFKAESGKAVSPDELKNFIDNIDTCCMYIDSEKKNIVFTTDQNGKVQKYVFAPNYELKANGTKFVANAFITAGIIRDCNLNESKYIKIR